MGFDLVIKNGTLIDGTGRPRYQADLGINNGKIMTISPSISLNGDKIFDAQDLIVAPGFIDLHSHGDWIFPLSNHGEILSPLLAQGVTTLVTGNCGFSPAPVTDDSVPLVDAFSEFARDREFPYSWRSMAEFYDVLDNNKLVMNAAFLVGHGTLRYAAMGKNITGEYSDRRYLGKLSRQALREGAYGLSMGLAYAPGIFATNEELLALLNIVKEEEAIFTVHGRAYSWVSPFYKPMIIGKSHNLRSVQELLGLSKKAGVKVQLSHQIFVGRHTWRTHQRVLRAIEKAAEDGVDVGFDAFPYTVGNTLINVVFPAWFLDGFSRNIDDENALAKLKKEMDLLRFVLGLNYKDITLLWAKTPEMRYLEGMNFAAIAEEINLPEFDAYIHVARKSKGEARVLLDTYSGDQDSDTTLQNILSHPLCAFMTDTILTSRGKHNPASFGTFPRILGHYCRDLKLFSLEDAVHRMTGYSADRIGLKHIGRLEENSWADIVIFDPNTIEDRTTRIHPDVHPEGVKRVMISGQWVVIDGTVSTDTRYGRLMRRN